MKKKVYKTLGFYIGIVSSIACCYLLYCLFQWNAIPVVWVGLILFLLIGLGFYLLLRHRVIGTILFVLLIGISSFGSYYIHQVNVAIEKVTVPAMSEAKFMMVSLNDQDCFERLGVASIGNVELQELALSKLSDTYDCVYFDSFLDLGEALMNRSVDAICVSDISYELLLEMESISKDFTKIVKEWIVEVDSTVSSIPVDVIQDPFTVYISGRDLVDYSTAFSHSDVNILMTINPTTHQILMLGIPRDTYIPQTKANNQKDKLTHTGLYGANCIVDSVSNFFEVPINYYVEVNFNSLIHVVDALDGVVVDSPFAFSTSKFDFVQGENQLNGESTLAFCRERYSFEDGDKERSRNQMRVLKAIINKAMSPAIIQNYSELMESLSDSFTSNMTQKEMTSFLSSQLKNLKDWDIQQIQIGGNGIMTVSPALGFEVYMMDPDMNTVESATSLMEKMLNGEKLSSKDIENHNEKVISNQEWMANV